MQDILENFINSNNKFILLLSALLLMKGGYEPNFNKQGMNK